MVVNEACERIRYLIVNALKKVASTDDGWDVLYVDPNDSRYWELIYAESYMHGGGPPTLRHLSSTAAAEKYNL
ncbi:MAG: Imm27 family immunity protein [Alphaproteobacteria bacterium]|nr:Imm27 family immunity protein [Alphaproteobacteria bacterium]